jgi:hypothetical protein
MTVTPNDAGGCAVVCFSRNGKEFENFKLIEEQITTNYTLLLKCKGY